MMSREAKKNLTRRALMDAALNLVGEGENFARISLREVAKNAGVVPTSFYRHFRDMEELGLNIVDDLGMLLRKLMRSARQADNYLEDLTQKSIDTYADFVVRHQNHFYFMCQCRTGGTPALRNAIRQELRFFANELAADICQQPSLAKVSQEDLELIAQHIVATVAETTIDLLDLAGTQRNFRHDYTKQLQKKLRLIWLGARVWRSHRQENV